MSRFIKLSQCVINTNYISHIVIDPSVFKIKMTIYDLNGYLLLGTGGLSNTNYILDIDEKTNPSDYQIVNQWIGQIDTVKNPPIQPEMLNK